MSEVETNGGGRFINGNCLIYVVRVRVGGASRREASRTEAQRKRDRWGVGTCTALRLRSGTATRAERIAKAKAPLTRSVSQRSRGKPK
ncbi:hypothetical protein [Nostoc flagelliforme]|uniref:hypothetical protein n=1 Tax=Nostoc flagelliforme TaxID=1306274 RepID=UPI0012FDA33C|nr:hypothetical protein [Nostoc flagelliforme]